MPGMTMTEQILAKHSGKAQVQPGDRLQRQTEPEHDVARHDVVDSEEIQHGPVAPR